MSQSKNHQLAILAQKEILEKVTIAMRSSSGPKRWFWELLQNAIDTISDEPELKINIKVLIETRPEGRGAMMHFSHDGKPFKQTSDPNRFDDFKNLILPGSGKKTSNTKTVGKFGTGFLSTHNISLKIDVGGVYEQNGGEKFKIVTTLDRTYFMDEDDKFDSKRIASITDGLDKFDESLKLKEPFEKEDTKFSYYLNDESAISKVRTGLRDIEQSLPIVMALNSKIGSVQIDNKLDGDLYTYEYGDTYEYKSIKIQNCIRGSDTFSVAYLSNEKLTLCWPVEKYSGGELIMRDARNQYRDTVKDKMPVIYSTFPMIGSSGLKFPIIVHSPLFKPNEKRDGISLTDEIYTDNEKNEEIELDRVNKSLIEEAVNLYGDFLEVVSPECKNLFYISKVNGTPTDDWISKIWHAEKVSAILQKKILRTSIIDVSEFKNERKSILDSENNVQVYFPSLSNGNDLKRKTRLNQKLYIFCKQLFDSKIPLWKDLDKWHNILWTDDEVIIILEIEQVAKEIAENYKSLKELANKLDKSIDGTLKWLNHLYAFIDELSQQKIYEHYEIIPNQKGFFNLSTELRSESEDSKIEAEVICILRSLNPDRDLFGKLIHRNVRCQYTFQERSLKENIGPEINKLLIAKDENGYYTLLKEKEKAARIIQRLLSFKSPSENEKSNKKEVFNFSQDIFGLRKERTVSYYHDFDTTNTVKHMLRLINGKISDSKNIYRLSKTLCFSKESIGYLISFSDKRTLIYNSKRSTILWLNRFLNFQVKSSEFEHIIQWANVVPNQYEKFKAHGEKDDHNKMYRPYIFKESKSCDSLDPILINILLILSTVTGDKKDWKEILVLDGIELITLEAKTWFELGKEINMCVESIAGTIMKDSAEQRESYSKSLFELLEWRDNNIIKVHDYFTDVDRYADYLGYQLAFSKENLAILMDKATLDVAKRLKKSNITVKEIEETLDVLELMKSKLGIEAISDFLRKAERYISVKEIFKNRFETGQNIEDLLKEALDNEGIDVEVDKSGKGSYDIRLSKNSKELKLEVKSYKYNSTYDFKFANSQIIEANNDSKNYVVCTLQRKLNDDVCDIEYLKQNLKVQPNLRELTADIYPTVSTFNSIYTQSIKNEIPLEIPCIEEPRVRLDHNHLLSDTGNYEDLIGILKQKFS